jgi:hypothetical protein
MTTFDKREQGFEKKFTIDEELRFKATARRNRLLGDWAAAQLGLTGDAATAYAKNMVTDDLARAGGGDILHHLSKDLAQKGISEEQIHQKMGEFFHAALEQMKSTS